MTTENFMSQLSKNWTLTFAHGMLCCLGKVACLLGFLGLYHLLDEAPPSNNSMLSPRLANGSLLPQSLLCRLYSLSLGATNMLSLCCFSITESVATFDTPCLTCQLTFIPKLSEECCRRVSSVRKDAGRWLDAQCNTMHTTMKIGA